MNLKLGKLPATKDSRDLLMANYLTGAPLPKRPSKFGHTNLLPADVGMLGNDRYGDCVFASAAHLTMLWNAEAGRKVEFNDEGVLSDYAAVTGFDPSTGANDNGTNMRDMLNYWRQTGIVDAQGNRHKIAGYAAIDPSNLDHVLTALWLFDLDIGFVVTQDAMDRFRDNDIWDVSPWSGDMTVLGGHCVPPVSLYNYINSYTWGRLQGMTQRFFRRQCDEVYAVFSEEMLNDGKSLEGFDLSALQSDLSSL